MTKNSRILSLIVMMIAILGTTVTANAYYIGQRGQEVVDIQLTLLESGYDIPALSSGVAKPGYFGVQTQKALTAYEASKIPRLGSVVGPDVNFRMFLNEGVTVGGSLATTSTATTYTTSEKDFRTQPTVILWTPNVSTTTISLSSTSTRGYVPKVGDVASIYIRNATTTANHFGSALIFAAADSGLDLQTASTSLKILGLDWAKITFIRTATHLVTAILTPFIEAD